MKQACCRPPRAKRGIIGLIEIVIVAVIILGGVLLYINMSKSALKTEKDLDSIGTTTTTATGAPAAGGANGTAAPAHGGSPTADFQRVGNEPQSLPGKVLARARGEGCESNLRQLRMLIDSAKTDNADGKAPASLDALPEAAQIKACPQSKAPYTYDPATGEVHCTYSGHEKY
jgi:hypothetical protein